MTPVRIAVLDDWENIAPSTGPWKDLADTAEVQFHRAPFPDRSSLVAALADRDVVVLMRERTPFPASLIEALPRLQMLVTTGAQNAAIDLAACHARNVIVCGTRSHPGATVELTWALMLAAARRLDLTFPAMRAGGWPASVGMALRGRTLGVLGLGRVGAGVAAVGAAFGMNVIAWSPHLTADRAAAGGARAVGREELFVGSDLVSLHAPLDTASRHSVGARELSLLGPDSWLVNTARAGLVERSALLAALDGGAIAGAAIDVFDDEPSPAEDPLRRHPRVVCTPHRGYATDRQFGTWYTDVVEDVLAWAGGHPVRVIR